MKQDYFVAAAVALNERTFGGGSAREAGHQRASIDDSVLMREQCGWPVVTHGSRDFTLRAVLEIAPS